MPGEYYKNHEFLDKTLVYLLGMTLSTKKLLLFFSFLFYLFERKSTLAGEHWEGGGEEGSWQRREPHMWLDPNPEILT